MIFGTERLQILLWRFLIKSVSKTIMSSYTQGVFPSTSLDESSIDFEFEMDRNLYLDMRDTHLSLKLQLFKGRLFEAFKKRKRRTKQNRRKIQMRNRKLT